MCGKFVWGREAAFKHPTEHEQTFLILPPFPFPLTSPFSSFPLPSPSLSLPLSSPFPPPSLSSPLLPSLPMNIGGVVNVAVDSDGLGEYAELDPSVDTMDEFTEKLVRNNVIKPNVTDRCEVHASTTASKNIEVAFSARNSSAARYCHEMGQDLANRINRNMTRPRGMMGMMGSGDEEADLPPELEFAAAATSAPLVVDEIPSVTPTAGAPQLVSSLFLLLASMLFISLF